MQSESIGKLADALAKAQAHIKAPKKGRTAKVQMKTGGSYSYRYADLAEVIDSYREPLTANGLALAHATRIEDGHIVLVTKLMHSSGEWLASEFPVSMFDKPQEQGSAITYARRYAVTALLGIAAEEDDDGAAAQAGETKKNGNGHDPGARAPEIRQDRPAPEGPPIQEGHRGLLLKVARSRGLLDGNNTDDLKKFIAKHLGRSIGSSTEVLESEFDGLLTAIRELPVVAEEKK